tara:strand:- start:117 stop:395 length:279 start_codon:yes stop_codon:yes gene_type:complete
MAKAKTKPAAPATTETPVVDVDDGTISREEAKAQTSPSTPKATDVEKSESFTAAFKNDAHAAADHWLDDREETSRKESNAGDDGVRVTITYK